ncbi:MAG: methylmalonyl-CoA epimerase [Chloroflexota bacterium]
MTPPLDSQKYELHHLGVVVSDLSAAEERYAALGFTGGERFEIPEQGVRIIAFRLGAGYLELIQPTDPEGAIARFMQKRGEGMHHVAFRVPDLQAALDELAAAGVRLIDTCPRNGAHGWRVAFVHPEAGNGVLIELLEDHSR